MMNDLVKEIKHLGVKLDENVNIVKLTTYKAGGTASIVAYPSKVDQLIELIKLLKVNNTWIGNTYNYKEAYEKNYLFKWGEDDQFYNNLRSILSLTLLVLFQEISHNHLLAFEHLRHHPME